MKNKNLMKLLSIIVIVLLGLFFLRGFIVKSVISSGVKMVTGLDLKIGRLDIGVFRTAVAIKNVELLNPSGFPERVMMDIPEILLDYDLGAILKGRIHMEDMIFELKELNVVKNSKGELNLDSLKVGGPGQQKETKPQKQAKVPEFVIDKLRLDIGKAKLIDYSKGTPPKVTEFNVNIHENYSNITDPYSFGSLIVFKALRNTTISSLTNFNLGPLQNTASGALGTATKAVSGAVDQVAGTVSKTIDSIFGTSAK